MREFIDSLEPGCVLYLHPIDSSKNAYLGRYVKVTEDKLLLELGIEFGFDTVLDGRSKLWIPIGYSYKVRQRSVPLQGVLNGEIRLHFGYNNILDGMKEHDNPNYILANAVMNRLK